MTTRSITSPLISNGYTLDPQHLGWLEPSDPQMDRRVLWEQYREQGYLWLKGILPRESVLDFRRRFFQCFAETGLLEPETDPVEGVYTKSETLFQTHPNKVIMEVVRWAAFEAFCMAEPIIRFYEDFLEGAVYLHKRKLIRWTKPLEPRTTAPHYDLIYLRGGTERVVTSWIPIGDIPVEMGGLVYLEKSHHWGRRKEHAFKTANAMLPPDQQINPYNKNMQIDYPIGDDVNALAAQIGGRWLIADYEAGDMVVHDPYFVHTATVNHDPHNRIRLSTDIRYQRVRDEIDVRWQNHYSFDDML
jgi:ectoine hydroxylase-related dioxygenase (phytanoyl-CoA dioxygenase family)